MKKIYFLLAILLTYSSIVAANDLKVRHIRPESAGDLRNYYYIDMLRLALNKTSDIDSSPTLIMADKPMLQNRAIEQLKQNKDIDVLWTMTSIKREAELQAIRIPLLKGLLGYRIFIIREGEETRFAGIHTLDDLKQLTAGQGKDWPDTKILRVNGIKVVTGINYKGLFGMLQLKRFDYFPRGVNEAWAEVKAHPDKNLVVEKTLLLQYPAPIYFFVNKQNKKLADRLERGLGIAIKDGSFAQLFKNHPANKEIFEFTRIDKRKIFRLQNPFLPQATPIAEKALWYTDE